MTDINHLLSAEQRAALEGVKASLAATPEPGSATACRAVTCKDACDQYRHATVTDGFRTCKCSHTEQAHAEAPFKASGTLTVTTGQDLNAEPFDWERVRLVEAPVTTINGVEYDLRSEGFAETACADCKTGLRVEIAPQGADLEVLTSEPRVAVCIDCGKARLAGAQGRLVFIKTPAPTEPEPLTIKEKQVLDLSNFSNAQLAQAAGQARDRMAAEEAERIRVAAEEAEEARKVADREAVKARKADRAEQGKHKRWMGGFVVNGKEVPAFDFTEVHLGEVAPPKVRSPYNKALHSLGEPLLDKETATFEIVRALHKRLFKMGEAKPEQQRLVAVLDPDAQAKIEAFATVTGKTHDEARQHLVAVGVI